MGKGFTFPKINHEEILNRFRENLKGKSSNDERFFKISRNEQGSGVATIRWLPGRIVDGKEQLQYAVLFRHSLNWNGKNYNTICPTTHGKPCPICEWNKTQDSDWVFDNNFYRNRKYISNILIIDDVKKENIGKVMLFEYGPQVMKILEAKLYPKNIPGSRRVQEPLFYFDFDEGANFELVLTQENKKSFPKWDNSAFLAPSSIMEFLTEKNIDPQYVVDSLYDLEEIIKTLDIPPYETIEREFFAWLDSVGLLHNTPTTEKTISRIAEATKTTKPKTASEMKEEDDELPEVKGDVVEEEETKLKPVEVKTKVSKFRDFMKGEENLK